MKHGRYIASKWALLLQLACLSFGYADKPMHDPFRRSHVERSKLSEGTGIDTRSNISNAATDPTTQTPSIIAAEKDTNQSDRLRFFKRQQLPESCIPPDGKDLNRTEERFYDMDYVTYNLSTGRSASIEETRTAVAFALKVWSSVTPLVFAEVNGEADVAVTFGEPNVCMKNPLEVLACANKGFLRFNDNKDWFYSLDEYSRNNRSAYNMVCFALHEMGHVLGLSHSCTAGTTMYPYVTERYGLDEEDAQRIQKVYGTPDKNVWYFYNEFMNSFMTDPDGKCPVIKSLGASAKPWELLEVVAYPKTHQIRSTADSSLCIEATNEGLTSLADCAHENDAQKWLRTIYTAGDFSTFQNVGTKQYLYAFCDDPNVCTKPAEDTGYENVYLQWKVARDASGAPAHKDEEANVNLKDPVYFYNRPRQQFMSPPECKCAALLVAEEDAKPWLVVIVNREPLTYQMYSTSQESDVCLAATSDGLTTLADCDTNDDSQKWLNAGNGDYSTLQNVATLQYLDASCEDGNICTKASDSGGNEFEQWIAVNDKAKVSKPA